MEQNKRRKLGPGKYLPAEPPGAAGKGVAMGPEPTKERLHHVSPKTVP